MVFTEWLFSQIVKMPVLKFNGWERNSVANENHLSIECTPKTTNKKEDANNYWNNYALLPKILPALKMVSHHEQKIEILSNMHSFLDIKRLYNNKLTNMQEEKPWYGQYAVRRNDANVDKHKTHQCLTSVELKAETEEFIMVAQVQSLFIRNYQKKIKNGADLMCKLYEPRLLTT